MRSTFRAVAGFTMLLGVTVAIAAVGAPFPPI